MIPFPQTRSREVEWSGGSLLLSGLPAISPVKLLLFYASVDGGLAYSGNK